MTELAQLFKILAIQSYRYNTFRGKWSDMPNSTGLCIFLGAVSILVCTIAIFIEYDLATAFGVPMVWLAGMYIYASEGGAWAVNKQLLSAGFLFTIPMAILLILMGRGHEYIEVIIGVYMSSGLLMLKTRG